MRCTTLVENLFLLKIHVELDDSGVIVTLNGSTFCHLAPNQHEGGVNTWQGFCDLCSDCY